MGRGESSRGRWTAASVSLPAAQPALVPHPHLPLPTFLCPGHAWVTDYGNPEDEGDFRYILRYRRVHGEAGVQPAPACGPPGRCGAFGLHSLASVGQLSHQLQTRRAPLHPTPGCSPIHNVVPPENGGQYPAFMITTGDHDDRVVPLHSHKLTATLQHVLAGEHGRRGMIMAHAPSKARTSMACRPGWRG